MGLISQADLGKKNRIEDQGVSGWTAFHQNQRPLAGFDKLFAGKGFEVAGADLFQKLNHARVASDDPALQKKRRFYIGSACRKALSQGDGCQLHY